MSAARPALIERLQSQVAGLEREAARLRTLDRSMRDQLRHALERCDDLQRTTAAQADMLADLRRQLAARGVELELVRAELAAEKSSRPATSGSSTSTESAKPEASPTPTRWNRLEID